MTAAEQDILYMTEALALAESAWGMTNPNPTVGAVIVKEGRIIGRGLHREAGSPHAEINALKDAGENYPDDIRGSVIYVTLEPCSTYGRTPPCCDAIIKAGISRVVIGCTDPNPAHAGKGIEILQNAGISVTCGVLEKECRYINRMFFHWITTGKPYVLLKLATTLDGKIAAANGASQWITGEAARKRVQLLRLASDAVMVGAATARIDSPRLTVRDYRRNRPQPLRIVASSSMSKAELDEIFPDGNAITVDLRETAAFEHLLDSLGRENRMMLLIEGGGELAASALAAGIVDEVEFHIAPKILGGRDSRSAVGGKNPESLDMAKNLYDTHLWKCGNDFVISGLVKKG